MQAPNDSTRGDVMLGDRVIATGITYGEFVRDFAGRPVEWVGQTLKFTDYRHIRPDEIIEKNVSYEDYLNRFAYSETEWVEGIVIKAPNGQEYRHLEQFLTNLLGYYLKSAEGGTVVRHTLVRPAKELPARRPDLAMILPYNAHIIHEREITGAPDVIIEIVSRQSHRRDRLEKFVEYEFAGVKEYWMIEPHMRSYLFCQLNERHIYDIPGIGEHGVYHSVVLPKLRLPVDMFWSKRFPDNRRVRDFVDEMLKDTLPFS